MSGTSRPTKSTPERSAGASTYAASSATFTQALTASTAERTVAITFDDAHRSVRELALPLLERLGWRATVFVPTHYAETGALMDWEGIADWREGPHRSELSCMSWEELSRLQSSGWEIGSHARTHPRLTRLDDEAPQTELAGSRADCENNLGAPCLTLAYPYSDCDRRVVEAARRAGYALAATLPDRLYNPVPLQWPRVGVYHDTTLPRFRVKVSPSLRRLRTSPAWGLVESVRGFATFPRS